MNKKFSIKEVIVGTGIALFIPAFTFFCAYRYELGFCEYYQLSTDFIKPDLSSNVKFYTNIIGLFIFMYVCPNVIFYLLLKKTIDKRPFLEPFLRQNLIYTIYLLGWIYFSLNSNSTTKHSFIFLICLFLFLNLMALSQSGYIYLQTKAGKELREIYNEYESKVPFLDYPDILNLKSILGNNPKKSFNIIVLLSLIGYSCYYFGKMDALRQSTFYVSAHNVNFVILRKYGDDILLKNYDPLNNQIGDTMIVMKLGADFPQIFYQKNIGRLKPPSVSSK